MYDGVKPVDITAKTRWYYVNPLPDGGGHCWGVYPNLICHLDFYFFSVQYYLRHEIQKQINVELQSGVEPLWTSEGIKLRAITNPVSSNNG